MPSGVACAKYIPSQENACASAAPAMPTKVHSACAIMCFPVFIIFDYYFGDFLSVSKEVCAGPWHPDHRYLKSLTCKRGTEYQDLRSLSKWGVTNFKYLCPDQEY